MTVLLCYLQVVIGYKVPKYFPLTPSRKRMGRFVARGSYVAIAKQCLEDERMRKYIIKKLVNVLQVEMKRLCSNHSDSVLMSKSTDDLCSFSHDKIYTELMQHCPTLLEILEGCTNRKSPQANRKQVICVCAAILAKYRRPSMSLLQRCISLILYAGHCSKQVRC